MSKKAKTKKVSQNDLRKMMSEMKSKRAVSTPAKRTLATNSSAYKKALEDLKRIDALKKGITPEILMRKSNNPEVLPEKPDSMQTATLKRTHNENVSSSNFKEPSPKASKMEVKQLNKQPSGLTLGDYSSDSEEENEETATAPVKDAKASDEKDEEQSAPTSKLPEGFFDDPEVDAKIRGVETPSNAMDREWEEFQREIQKETGQSEQIVEEEQELGKVDREIEEIDEQIMHFQRVEKLNIAHDSTKEKLKSRPKPQSMEVEEEDEETDEDDEDEILDWREKDSHF